MAQVSHLYGDQEPATPESLERLIAELDQADGEHTDVSIQDEAGWCLSAFASGLVVWENVESDAEPERLDGQSRADMLVLFDDLRRGDLDAVRARRWRPYP